MDRRPRMPKAPALACRRSTCAKSNGCTRPTGAGFLHLAIGVLVKAAMTSRLFNAPRPRGNKSAYTCGPTSGTRPVCHSRLAGSIADPTVSRRTGTPHE